MICGYECRWNLCMETELNAVADSNWFDQLVFLSNVVWNVVHMEISCTVDAADETYHCNKGYTCN